MRISRISQSSKDPRHGFTMPEIVLATVLFALLATGLSQSVYYAMKALTETERRAGPPPGMMRMVREHILPITSWEVMTAGGDVNVSDDVTLTWEAEVFPTQVVDLYMVEAKVTFPTEMLNENEVDLNLMVYRPKWAEHYNRDSVLENLLGSRYSSIGGEE